MKWSVAEAKARLSELLNETPKAPQVIENRGREVAVVLSMDEYQRLQRYKAQTEPQVRMNEFLAFSARLREEGGAALALSPRVTRLSPFLDEDA